MTHESLTKRSPLLEERKNNLIWLFRGNFYWQKYIKKENYEQTRIFLQHHTCLDTEVLWKLTSQYRKLKQLNAISESVTLKARKLWSHLKWTQKYSRVSASSRSKIRWEMKRRILKTRSSKKIINKLFHTQKRIRRKGERDAYQRWQAKLKPKSEKRKF